MGNLWKNRLSQCLATLMLIIFCNPYQSLSHNPLYSITPSGQHSKDFYQEELEYETGTQPYYNPYHDVRVVDNKGRYTLEWTVDYKTSMITFNMTVRTTGWVGIGLSKDGSMKDADILVGWVGSNGQGYLMDLHSDYNRKLLTDSKQTWKLLAASENNGVTYLKVIRPLDTCDPYDYPITVDLAWILWAYGETDELEYHFDKRGSFRAFLMDPVLKPPEPHLEAYRIANQFTLFEKPTSYICSIHKGPHLIHKHHAVEFNPFLGDALSVNHTHHMVLWRCVAPPGMDARDIFEPLLGFPGEECYFNDDHVIPINLCREVITAWAIGGNQYVLPYSTGIPIGFSFDEFYMLEAHYNNPELQPLQLTSGFDIYYTNHLRKNDGGTLFISYDLFGLFMIPPISPTFEVYGFCTQNCSQSVVPDSGFEIVAAGLHTHYSGRRVKLQHFRDGKELEWIIKDDNYDSTFQQVRVLYEPRFVLPGDLLVLKCEYDNTWTNVTTVSGFSTQEEMCLTAITITKRVPYYTCDSQIPQETLLSVIGVEEVEWDIDTQERFITAPPELAGQPLSNVTDHSIDWTKGLRYKLQEVQLSTPSVGTCPQILISTTSDTSNSHQLQFHHLQSHQTQEIEHHVDKAAKRQQLHGTIISASANIEDILTLAKGYGTTTLMGDNTQLPTRTPGPSSTTVYPHGAERYNTVRSCPRSAPVTSSYYSSQSGAYAGAGAYQSPYPGMG